MMDGLNNTSEEHKAYDYDRKINIKKIEVTRLSNGKETPQQ